MLAKLNYHSEMEIEEITDKNAPAFLAMLEDYEKNDPATYTAFYDRKWSPKEFAKFVKECAKEKQDWRPAAKKTSVTRYVMPGKFGEILANGVLRFPLDEKTEIDGGNLHIDVSPKLRRHGYGSYCLALLLFEAVRAGLRRVLVTCPEKDLGARKMIEKNRGALQDIVVSTREGREGERIARYWISFS
jgi:predicted acetyltransferase